MSKKLVSVFLFAVVCAFALTRALLYFKEYMGWNVYLGFDDAIYAILSKRLLEGDFFGGFNPYWNSGFPLMTIPFYLLTQSWEKAQILVSMTSGVLLVFILYFSLKRFSIMWGVLAALIVAFTPSFVKLTLYWGTTEPLFVFLLWTGFYFAWIAFESKEIKHFLITGFLLGMAYLTRTEAMYSLAGFLLITSLSFLYIKRKRVNLKIFKFHPRLTILNKTAAICLLAMIIDHSYFSYLSIRKMILYQEYSWVYAKPPERSIAISIFFLTLTILSFFFIRNKTKTFEGIKSIMPRVVIVLAAFLLINLPYGITISKQLGKLTLSGKTSFIGSGHPFTPDKERLTSWAQDIWSLDYPNYSSPWYDTKRALLVTWKTFDSGFEGMWEKIKSNINYYQHNNIFTDWEFWLAVFGFISAVIYKKTRNYMLFIGSLILISFLAMCYSMDLAFRYLAFSYPLFYISQAFGLWAAANTLGWITSKFFVLRKFAGVIPTIVALTFIVFFIHRNTDPASLGKIPKNGRNADQKLIADWVKSQNIDVVMARTEGIEFYSGAKLVYIPAADPETIIKHAKAWGVEYIISRPAESSWPYMRMIVDPNFKNPNLSLVHQFYEGTLVWKVKLTPDEKINNYRTTKKI